MAAQLKYVLAHLLPHRCIDEYFINLNYYDAECLKLTLSKFLGIGIILGSVLVKVPQVVKILTAKSGAGINIWAVFLELLALTATIAYSLHKGFPFSAWGEGLFLLIQTTAIAILVLHFEGNPARVFTFLILDAAFLYWLLSGIASPTVLSTLQASNVPIIVVSKSIQILENYNNKSTGQLSAITVFLVFAGSLARIFTSVQETGDWLVVVTFIFSSLANGAQAAQMIYYWNSTPNLKAKEE